MTTALLFINLLSLLLILILLRAVIVLNQKIDIIAQRQKEPIGAEDLEGKIKKILREYI